jgi:CRISP-associated protein Cas1
MTVLYLTEQHAAVSLDAETLIVKMPPTGDQPKQKVRVPLMKVSGVVVQGNITLTTPAVGALLERGADICYLTAYGTFVGHTSGALHKHGVLRLIQRRAHDDPDAALHVAKVCVRSKLHNQRTQLLRGNRTRYHPETTQAVDTLSELIKSVDVLPDCDVPPPDPQRPQAGTVLGTLMGIEGAGAAAYFKGFGALLNKPWTFSGRHKRPPTDPINALLSYGYTILTNQTVAAAHIVGFDPYVGFLHSTQYGKPALALDIVEMFRIPIVDSVVLTLLNNGTLAPEDFTETFGAWRMRDNTRRTFLQKFEERMNTEIKHPVLGDRVSYRRCLELQMRLLSRWLLGELKRFRGFQIR